MRSPASDDVPMHPQNPRGFFEARSTVDLDDMLLDRLGASWDVPPILDPAALSSWWADVPVADIDVWRRGIELPASDDWHWSVKDPRLSFLVGAWDRIAVRRLPVVLCVRRPDAIAASLELGNGFTSTKSLALWWAHTRHAIAMSESRPVLILDYETGLAEPQATVDHLSAFLAETVGMPDSGDREAAARLFDGRLNRSGSHWRQPSELTDAADAWWQELASSHGQVVRRVPDAVPPAALSDLMQVMAHAHQELVSVRRARDDAQRTVAELATAQEKVSGELAAVRRELAEAQESAGWLTAELETAARRHDELLERAQSVEGSRLGRVVAAYRRRFPGSS